jgi:hypothetical protein
MELKKEIRRSKNLRNKAKRGVVHETKYIIYSYISTYQQMIGLTDLLLVSQWNPLD